MRLDRRSLMLAAGATLMGAGANAAPSSNRAPKMAADPSAVEWFREARFGMFIHWGVYSLLGRGEWVMNNERISIAEYQKLPGQFNPTKFSARDWVRLAKDSGQKYITITSKHHDGFCMYRSALTDFNIVDATPFRRDPTEELADECRRQGVKLFFYYSQLDWRHPDYFPRGRTGRASGRPERGDWNRYKEYYIGQVRELCTNYGEIGGLWFDGWWDRPEADWGHDELYGMIHQLQPQALVGNNHHRAPYPGEDFQMFEQDLPGENSSGFNTAQPAHLPFETCKTINRSWGLNTKDQRHRSAEELTRYLIQAAGRDANLLLNTGPLPTGEILPEHRERFLAIGKWLKQDENEKTIRGTRRGPYAPGQWGVSTRRGRRVYLHILNWPQNGVLELRAPDRPVRSVRVAKRGGAAVRQEIAAEKLRLTLPEAARNPLDSIVTLELSDA